MSPWAPSVYVQYVNLNTKWRMGTQIKFVIIVRSLARVLSKLGHGLDSYSPLEVL